MNIVFFGTSEFAIPSLRRLIASPHKVLALVTQPDSKKGRNLQLLPPPTKVLALAHGIPVYQPQNASAAESAQYLKDLGADLFIVVSFGQILRKNILALPKHYALNVHGSCLPKYRGAAPTNWAVINGDPVTGVTIMKMNERLDEGEVVTCSSIPIESEDTNITVSEKLAEAGAKCLVEVVDSLAAGNEIDFKPQDNSKASYAPKLKKEDGLVDWSQPAAAIHNKVRGLLPWPGAYTCFKGKILKILRTEIAGSVSTNETTGRVIDIVKGKGLIVNTGQGLILITHLQLEGKKPLDADAFLRGHRISVGEAFS